MDAFVRSGVSYDHDLTDTLCSRYERRGRLNVPDIYARQGSH